MDTRFLDPPPEYAVDPTPPVVTFVEWKVLITDRKLLICNEAGIALAEYGEDWHHSVVAFTPYLRSARFDGLSAKGIHMLPMTDASLLHVAEQAIRRHLKMRRSEISRQVIQQLKFEGLYPLTRTIRFRGRRWNVRRSI